MKRLAILTLVLFSLASSAGCGATATPTPASQFVVPWGAGDRAEYSIEMSGASIGSIVFATASKDDGYVLTTETTAGPVTDVANVRVDKNLKPIGVTRQVSGAGKSDFTLMTVYDKGKLAIQAKTADGDKAATIDVPADSWDNDQSLISIRALPLAEGYKFSYTNVVGMSAAALKTQIAVLGREKVDVPAGSFTAYKVELDFGQGKNYAWYDVNEPHHIVRYENTPIKQAIVLTKVGAP